LVIAGLAVVFGAMKGGWDTKEKTGKKTQVADWTCMFYFDQDNNLAEYNQMDTNLDFLMRVGSSKDVNLLCLLDSEEAGDTKMLYIRNGTCDQLNLSEADSNWTDEVNMGDPATLVSFGKWAMTEYPALRYNIMLSDHGGGWRGVCWDDTSNGDNLEVDEIRAALQELKDFRGGKSIEVLSTEACLVAMLEFAHGIRDVADYYIASETYGYGGENTTEGGLVVGNWQFDRVWGALVQDPKMGPEQLARTMVDCFNEYGPWRAPPFIPKKEASDTIAAFNLSRVGNLTNVTSKLSDFLVGRLLGPGMTASRDATSRSLFLSESFSGQLDWIGASSYTNFDLYDFCDKLETAPILNGVKAYTAEVKKAIPDVIFAEHHGTDATAGEHPNAHGISIYVPFRRSEYNEKYESIMFAKDTSWDEFIKALWFGP